MPNEDQLEQMKKLVEKTEAIEEVADEDNELNVTKPDSEMSNKFQELQNMYKKLSLELEEHREKTKTEKPAVNNYKKNHRQNTFTIARGARPSTKPKVKPPAKKVADKGHEAVLGERRGAFKIWPDKPVKNT